MGNDSTSVGVVYDTQTINTSLFWTSGTQRYQPQRETQLYDDGMFRTGDTVELCAVKDAAALILFKPLIGGGTPRDELSFKGPFCQLTNTAPGTTWSLNLVDVGSRNKVSSTMLVNCQRGPEIRQSFSDLFLGPWTTAFVDEAPDEVEQDGDPLFTWDPFPTWDTHGFLDPTHVYLTIHQKLIFDIPSWAWDYKASVTFHLHVYRQSDGRLRGYVRRYSGWVEGGVLTDVIVAILEPNLELAAIRINNALQPMLDAIGPVTGLYFLPGRQLTPVAAGQWGAFLHPPVNDVTIVVEP